MTERETVHGIHAVRSLLQRDPARIQSLLVLAGRKDQRLQQLLDLAREQRIPVQDLARAELERRVGGEVHQGVVAEVRPAALLQEADLFDKVLPGLHTPALLLLLDGVTDPHNLGACLRSAAAFGANALIIPRDNSAPLNATARKVASGAAELVPLISVTNLARCMRQLQDMGIWLIGAAGEAEQAVTTVDLRGPVGLVLGAEGGGLRRLTREGCDFLARIPMHSEIGSLNVSVATGIFLYETSRQRSA